MPVVLIVVDEPDIMLELRFHVEAGGHRALLAADADTALERLVSHPVDVVVLDVMMPVRDGWTVLEVLQADPDAPPVIIVSGRASPGHLQRASRLGASLISPVTAAGILRAITRAVALSKAQPSPTL